MSAERFTNARRGYLARQRMAAHDLWHATDELSGVEDAIGEMSSQLESKRARRDRLLLDIAAARVKLAETCVEAGTRGEYDA